MASEGPGAAPDSVLPEPSRVPLAPGQVIDGFRLEGHAHQGGMANLWRVTRVGREAAGSDPMPLMMKVPRIKGGEDPATIVGFEVEQMILPALSGVHVPKFVAKGDFTRTPYIVMEAIPGSSLRTRFERAPLPPAEVADLGARIATALNDLHRQQVIHLDIKPSNIMFRTAADGSLGEAVLVDFGLSRHAKLPDLLDEEFELPMGTGPYMSPEQIQFVRNDPRSDLFALGVLLYHLATGERPFGAPNTVRGLRQRLYKEPVPPRAHNPQVPPWLQEIVLRCLEVDPNKRHQTAAQLAFDLMHPEEVPLTERATKTERRGGLSTVRRWFGALGASPPTEDASAELTVTTRPPILLAAVDVAGAEPALLEAVRQTVQRLLTTDRAARLACLAVMKLNLVAADELVDKDGTSRHVKLLVGLKHWAHPLVKALDLQSHESAGRLTFHVIEASDPAQAIVDYARKNQVDHIVMGARSSGGLRRYLGSVSAQVAAEADCNVTVVRASAPR